MKMQDRTCRYILCVAAFWSCLVFAHAIQASADPLIYANNLKYLGAFKVPVGDEMSYGGSVITYNQTNNSLFIVGNNQQQKVAEISIPTPVNSEDLAALNRATFLQPLSDITESSRRNIGPGGLDVFLGNAVNLGGLLVYGGKLIGTSYAYFSTEATSSHFTSGLTLSTTGDFSGMYAVGSSTGGVPTASFVSGWMSNVPAGLQTELGGPVLTGNGSLSILSRTSFGPAAFSFDPADLGVTNPVPATPLLYYPQAHQTLNINGYTNPIWNDTTKIAGMTMIDGSRSILYIGYHGIGERNYGQPSNDPIYADICVAPDSCITGPKGWPICEDPNNCTTGRKGIPYDPLCNGSGSDGCYYDPTGMGAKGPHAYPYVYQVWAYDANDLAEVKNGLKKPWEVVPYAVWQLPFSVAPTSVFGGATAYDPVRGRLYVTMPKGEEYGCCQKLPLIHVFQIDLNAPSAPAYKIKGKVVLLNGSVTLNNNGIDELTVTSSDRNSIQEFSFPTPIAPGRTYDVTIAKQPIGKSCTTMHGTGTVNSNTDIENIVIYCNKSLSAPMPPSNLEVM